MDTTENYSYAKYEKKFIINMFEETQRSICL